MIWRPVTFATLTLLAVGLCGARAGEPPQSKDLDKVQACLKTHQGSTRDREKCIDVVAGPCIGDEASRKDFEVTACLRREETVWDQLLNAAYRKLRDNLEEEQRNKLRDMQKSWIDSRERTCAFFYDFFQGTMANPMIANCNNRETARRALFLMGFVDDLQRVDESK
jgi:uncharacterized protein YecT (DUF1311 family)